MAEHTHTWFDHARLAGDRMQEVCRGEDGCGETRIRKMSAEEKAEFAEWREEMERVDREGEVRAE